MKEPKWLLCDDDFYDCDWFINFLPDVGVFCSSYAKVFAEGVRFYDFEYMDCPHCGYYGRNYIMKKGYKCKKCHKKYSITTGTYIQDSKLPMEYWYRLCYLLGDLKVPLNSRALARDLCISQKSCYLNLLKVKEALRYDFKGINFSIPLEMDSYKLIGMLLTINPKIKEERIKTELRKNSELNKLLKELPDSNLGPNNKPYEFSKKTINHE